MGRCIYGGIYDPGNSLSDKHGYRTDVLGALRELEIPVIRYPGGNFIATYRWEDGVGPRENRPTRPELAWDGTESNQIGQSSPFIFDNLSANQIQERMSSCTTWMC